jgi:hypothetical protein
MDSEQSCINLALGRSVSVLPLAWWWWLIHRFRWFLWCGFRVLVEVRGIKVIRIWLKVSGRVLRCVIFHTLRSFFFSLS